MKSETLEGFFPTLLKKLVSKDLPPLRFFILEKGKLQYFPLKALKVYLKNLKISNVPDMQFWKSVICRKSNLLESNYSVNSEKQFRLKFKFAKVADCKITVLTEH